MSVVLFLIIITTVTIVAMIIVISKKRSHKFTYTVQYPAVEDDVNLMTEYHINTRNGTKLAVYILACMNKTFESFSFSITSVELTHWHRHVLFS